VRPPSQAAHPAEAERFERQCAGELPADWQDAISSYAPESKALATRQWSELVLNEVGRLLETRLLDP
jgi:transketolase